MISLILIGALAIAQPDNTLAEWRAAREQSLKTPTGWLSVAGLFWLQPGDSTIGSAAESKVQFPASAPGQIGTLNLSSGEVTIKVSPGVALTVNGKEVTEATLKSDAKGRPDSVKVGDLMFRVIERGGRVGIRLYDPNAQTQQEFKGLHWYPADEKWMVKAKFTAYNPPRQLRITNILGDTAPVASPGFVTFKVANREVRLEAEDAGDGLFFNFKDATNGKGTYLAGRFLDTEKPKDGWVTLDFNRATNPPCAYTAYATCPLAPRANHLTIPVPAGEKSANH